ncbi:MAG TPA: DinB family protein [Candidatus Dormibacteraeota bacterium]|nr:DinB family protein [Candidatus Dormibacteraeota bacterium]
MTETILDELTSSQSLVIAMTRVIVDDQTVRVGAWTLRDIAAHLATTERECFEPRVRAMAEGRRPSFDWYSNDERDFDGVALESALTEWTATRERLIAYVRGLTAGERQGIGVHTTYGEISVDDYLQIALEHDHDHLGALERLAGELAR